MENRKIKKEYPETRFNDIITNRKSGEMMFQNVYPREKYL